MATAQEEGLLREPSQKSAGTQRGQSQRSPSFYEKYVQDWWLMEILSLLLGTASIIALCITLAEYDQNPVPHSNAILGVDITLNTLVSILSTISRATALFAVAECIGQMKWTWYLHKPRPLVDLSVFDDASRGVLGGFQLLWSINVHHIASFGALLAILGLAVDPLSQQLVHYQVRRMPGFQGSANLTAAVIWDDYFPGRHFYGPRKTKNEPPLPVKAAIQSALVSGNLLLNDTAPYCPGGNCTWPSYCSLAVCARSADVTSHLKTKKVTLEDDFGPTQDVTRWYLSADNYLLEDNMALMNLSSAAKPENPDDALAVLKFVNSIEFKNSSAPLVDAFMIYQNDKDEHDFLAEEMLLEWCVQNFTTSVTNGIPSSIRHNAFTNFSLELDGPTAQPECAEDRMYRVRLSTNHMLQVYLQDLVRGSVSLDGFGDFYKTTDAAEVLFEPFNTLADNTSTAFTNRVVGKEGLRRILDNIAISTTNMLRVQYMPPGASEPESAFNGTIQGHADYQQTYVDIQWPWIAGPLIVLIGSIMFTVAGIVSTSSSKTRVWKTGSLPVLHTLTRDLHDELGSMRDMSMMEMQASNVVVKLVGNSDVGWKLAPTQTLLKQRDDDQIDTNLSVEEGNSR